MLASRGLRSDLGCFSGIRTAGGHAALPATRSAYVSSPGPPFNIPQVPRLRPTGAALLALSATHRKREGAPRFFLPLTLIF